MTISRTTPSCAAASPVRKPHALAYASHQNPPPSPMPLIACPACVCSTAVAHSVYGIPQTINCANYMYFVSMAKARHADGVFPAVAGGAQSICSPPTPTDVPPPAGHVAQVSRGRRSIHGSAPCKLSLHGGFPFAGLDTCQRRYLAATTTSQIASALVHCRAAHRASPGPRPGHFLARFCEMPVRGRLQAHGAAK